MNRIEAADFEDITQISEPRVAPGDDRVAFVRKAPKDDEEYEATIYLVSVGGNEPRRFTISEGVDSEPRFSPSGDRLAFVSTRGADDDRPQLWVMPTDGGEATQVTNVAGGVSGIAWSPDGTRIAFTQQVGATEREDEHDLDAEEYEPDEPDPRVVDRTVFRSMQRYFDGKRSHIYLVQLDDLQGSERPEVERLTDGDHDFGTPEWGDDETLYITKNVGDPDPDDSLEYEILAYDTDSGDGQTLHTTTGWGHHLAATADGRVAHLFTDPEQSTLKQTELDVLTADGAVVRVTEQLDRTLGFGAVPQWGPNEDQLYFTTPDEGAASLWRTPWEEPNPTRVLRDEWTSIDGVHVGDDVIGCVLSEWDHPGDLFVTSLGGGERNRLTRINAEYLDQRAVSQPEELRYPAGDTETASAVGDDEYELQGWLLTPPDFDPETQYPLVVEVHGGPHGMWTTSGTMWHEFQTLAARGYVVFWSNPRGSAGYGEAFMRAIERDWGDVTMADVMAGVSEVAAREYVDETQLFLTGGSFGGFMTGWMVGQTDEFQAAVAQRGVYDLTGLYGSTDGAYKLVEGDFDTTPWDEPEFLWNHSPTGHAHEVETPTLLIHSEDDYRTPMCTAELFHRILRKHGVDTRLVRYPNEGHELSRSGQPGHIIDRIERIARWFDGYSEYHDAPPALEREADDGLTAGEEDGEDETEN